MKLVALTVALLTTTAPTLPDEAVKCIDSGECVVFREQDLKAFIEQIKRQADSKIWCRNA